MAYLLDTNVMWRRFAPADPRYPEIKAAIDALFLRGETLYITSQNMLEFQSLATRPAASNGLGLSREAANAKAGVIETLFPLLEETPAIYPLWRKLMEGYEANGKAVHDARLVAVMEAHGVTRLLTLNPSHFLRFSDRITIVEPQDV